MIYYDVIFGCGFYRGSVYMKHIMKKINNLFFMMAMGVPVVGSALSLIIFYPIFKNIPYSGLSSSPILTILGGYIFVFAIFVGIVAYIGIPYLVTIKGDTIVFYRLRKKVRINLRDVEKVEIIRKIPIKPLSLGGGVIFYLNDGQKYLFGLMSHATLDFLKNVSNTNKIYVIEHFRKTTEDEIKILKKGGCGRI